MIKGRYSYGDILNVGNMGEIHVGNFCSIADNVQAIMVGHDPHFVSTFPFNSKYFKKQWPEAIGIPGHPTHKGDIVIGNDVWIGRNVTLLSGITIFDGAVIAANSVVTRSVSAYSVVGGNPCGHIKTRFTFQQIQSLLRIKWWNWDEEKIRSNVHFFCSANINDFLRKHDENFID